MISLVGSGRVGEAKFFVDQYGANPSSVNFGQALVSHLAPDGWWQYAAWYAPSNAVTIARKHEDDAEWESVTLPFGLQHNDSHNSINLGISTTDGRLHLCAGQHNEGMQYTRSYEGFLNDGFDAVWSSSTFESSAPTLGGTVVGDLTYPTFTAKPDGGLLFAYRNGGPTNGRMRLVEYDDVWTVLGDVTSSAGNWVAPNNGAISPSRNFYWAHPTYDDAGVLHLAGTWNEQPSVLQVPTAPVAQHHIVYVTSPDHGRTWHNSAGSHIATTGSDPIHVHKPGIHVPQSTTDTRYALLVPDLTLGPDGLVAILADYVSPDLLTNSPKHVVNMDHRVQFAGNHPRWRTADGVWSAQSVRVNGELIFNRYPAGRKAATRGKVVFAPNGDMHVIHSGVRICSASAPDYTDWQVTFRGQNYLYAFGEMGGIDRSRPDRVSVLYIEQAPAGATSSAVCVRDFLLEP